MTEYLDSCPACDGLECITENGWNKDGTAFLNKDQNCGVCKGKGVMVKQVDDDVWEKINEDRNFIKFKNINKPRIEMFRRKI